MGISTACTGWFNRIIALGNIIIVNGRLIGLPVNMEGMTNDDGAMHGQGHTHMKGV